MSEPPFALQSVVQWTEQAYREISTFFQAADKAYFVFLRHNEAGALGGAALPGSFMVGYGADPAPTPERLQGMLAHEIVHNAALEISYVPRAAAVSGQHWTRVPGVPDSACAL